MEKHTEILHYVRVGRNLICWLTQFVTQQILGSKCVGFFQGVCFYTDQLFLCISHEVN